MNRSILAVLLTLAACASSGSSSSGSSSSSSSSGSSSSGGSSGSTGSATTELGFLSASAQDLTIGESATVTFQVLTAGAPAADGLSVSFALSSPLDGATLTPTTAVTAGGTGQVTTTLKAGPGTGTLTVQATLASAVAPAVSPPIRILSWPINLRYLSVACSNLAISGLDEAVLGQPMSCSVVGNDRAQGDVDGQLTLLSEAGSVPATVRLVAGYGGFQYAPTCPLPVDVDPVAGEFSDPSCTFHDRCAPAGTPDAVRTCNPRDGKAALVVFTSGEECFNDANLNNRYDDGEFDPACDQGEPYLDENDNGRWDPPCATDPVHCDPRLPAGERYVDADNNRTWTPPNGVWDAHTLIWRTTSIAWTGPATRVSVTPSAPLSVPCASGNYGFVALHLADVNGNVPTNHQGDNLVLASAGARISPTTLVHLGGCIEQPSPPGYPTPFWLGNSCGARLDETGLPRIDIDFNDPGTCPHADGGFTVEGAIEENLGYAPDGGLLLHSQPLGVLVHGTFQ